MERREFLKVVIAGSAASLLSRSSGQNLSGLYHVSILSTQPYGSSFSPY
jgi:hypothetical protein